jgi:hypothetical protein
MSPPLRQLALQGAAVILVLSLAWPYYGLGAQTMPWLEVSLAIGVMAFCLSTLASQPWWWRVIHGSFMPLGWAVYGLAIDPGWFLAGFAALLLIYRGAVTEQVPLYLSGHGAIDTLAELLAKRPSGVFVDLGAGIGSTLVPLSRLLPEWRFRGCENAPLTWLVGRLRCLGSQSVDWRWGDLWQAPLADAEVVYAFLSPAPMAALWEKVRAEMRPGTLFVSNSFPVPDRTPDQVIDLPGSTRRLYCYPIRANAP